MVRSKKDYRVNNRLQQVAPCCYDPSHTQEPARETLRWAELLPTAGNLPQLTAGPVQGEVEELTRGQETLGSLTGEGRTGCSAGRGAWRNRGNEQLHKKTVNHLEYINVGLKP